MNKQFLFGFIAGAIILTAGFAIAQTPKKQIADFSIIITVNQAENGVDMVCNKGCSWETFSFACENGEVCTSPINAYGNSN